MIKKIIMVILVISIMFSSSSCNKIIGNTSNTLKNNAENAVTLTISVSDKSLEPYIDEYEKIHKNVKINLKLYALPDDRSYEKYVKTVNTEILGNSASDIFSIQGLPYYQYVQKGALKNLDEFIKNDEEFNNDNYFMNILDGCKYNDSYYSLPISYMFNGIGIDSTALSSIPVSGEKMTYDKFLDLLNYIYEKNPQNSIMPNNVPLPFYQLIINNCYYSFIDLNKGEARFNSDDFKHLLNITKVINDKYINMDITSIQIKQDFSPQGMKVIPESISNIGNLLFLKGVFSNNVTYMNFPVYQDMSFCQYLPKEIYGINAASKNSKEAWAFLKSLISEDVQKKDKSILPVNRKAFNYFLEDIQKNGANLSTKKDAPGKTIRPFTDTELKSIESMIENLRVNDTYNNSISYIIYEEALDFYNGKRSVDDVAKSIQDRVEIYLGE